MIKIQSVIVNFNNFSKFFLIVAISAIDHLLKHRNLAGNFDLNVGGHFVAESVGVFRGAARTRFLFDDAGLLETLDRDRH